MTNKVARAERVFDKIEQDMIELEAENLMTDIRRARAKAWDAYHFAVDLEPVSDQKTHFVKPHLTHRPFVNPEMQRLRKELQK